MGAYQSKLSSEPTAYEKLVIDRLRALQLEEQNDGDYICVSRPDTNPVSEKTIVNINESRRPEALSVPLVGKWQETLLSDPKNRYEHRFRTIKTCICILCFSSRCIPAHFRSAAWRS